jgi:hypothetical protein
VEIPRVKAVNSLSAFRCHQLLAGRTAVSSRDRLLIRHARAHTSAGILGRESCESHARKSGYAKTDRGGEVGEG